MNRHNARIITVIGLYSMDIKKLTAEEALINLDDILALEAEEEYKVEIDEEFAKASFTGVVNNITKIDKIISDNLVGYTLDRLSYVDRAIIRLAVYEMIVTDIPKQVVINEAIEITKEYASVDDKQAKFTNRLLDNIASNYYGK